MSFLFFGTDATEASWADAKHACQPGESEKGKVTTALSRVVLRERGRTIAAGLVVEKPADKDKS